MLYCDFIILLLLLSGTLQHKSLLLRIIIFILWYPLFVLTLFKYGIPMGGILGLNMDTFSSEVVNYALYSYMIGLLLFEIIIYPCRKKIYNFATIKIDKYTQFFIFLLMCISCIPILNIHVEGENFKSSTFYLTFSTLLLSSRSGWLLKYGMIFVAFFLILKGERVDSILIIVLLLLFKGTSFKVEKYNPFYLIIGGSVFFILLVSVGYTRAGSTFNGNLLLYAIYSQQTITDVVYVYLTGVNYIFEHSLYPQTAYNIIEGFLPGGVTSPHNYSKMLREYMYNPGGGLYFTEGMLIIGKLGVILYLSIYGLIIKYLFQNPKGIKRVLFILLVVMQCRIVWYGIIFIYKPALLLSIFYILILYIKKSNSCSNKIQLTK